LYREFIMIILSFIFNYRVDFRPSFDRARSSNAACCRAHHTPRTACPRTGRPLRASAGAAESLHRYVFVFCLKINRHQSRVCMYVYTDSPTPAHAHNTYAHTGLQRHAPELRQTSDVLLHTHPTPQGRRTGTPINANKLKFKSNSNQ